MSQKSEIKVYLPLKLIGELEGRKRTGLRSKFIEDSIREKLRRFEDASLQDWPLLALLCNARDREECQPMQGQLLQLIINDLVGE